MRKGQKFKQVLNKVLSTVLCTALAFSSIATAAQASFSAATPNYYQVNGYNIPIFSHGLTASGVTPDKDFPGAMELPAVGMTNTYDVPSNMTWSVLDYKEDAVMKSFAENTNYNTRPISDQTAIAYLWTHLKFDRSNIVNIVGGNQASAFYDTRMDILKGFVATDPQKFGPAIMKTAQDGLSTSQLSYFTNASSYVHDGIEPDLSIRYENNEPIINDEKDYYLYGPVYFHSSAIYATEAGCSLDYQISCTEITGADTGVERPTLTDINGLEVKKPDINTEYYIKVPKALGRANVTITATGKFLKPSVVILNSSDGHNYWAAPVWRYDDVNAKLSINNVGKSVTIRIHRLDTSNQYVKGESEVTIRKPNGESLVVTLDNGFLEIPNMPLGSNYVFRETKAPDGYNTADNVTMDISDDGTVFNVYLQAAKYTVTQRFVVVSDTYEFLSGIRIDVYKDGVLFDSRWTNEKGIAEFKLPYGDYTYRQVTACDGYVPDYNDHKFSILDTTARDDIEIINKIMRGSVTVVTLDNATETPIFGAKYQLHKVEPDGTLTFVSEFTAHASTENIFTNVPYGDYVVTQVTPPTDYKETAARQSVSIRSDNLNKTLVFRNSIHSAEVTVTVRDDKGLAVPNASVSVFTIKQGVAREIYKLTTDVNGEVSLTTLDVGQYKIRLNSVNPEYTMGNTTDSVEKVITLTPENNRQTVNFNVARTIGSIQIEVYDVASNLLIPGARYEVRNDTTGFFRTFSTNGTEPVVLTDVPYGEYTITQTEAPAGYYEDSTPYKVRVEYDEHCALQVIYLGKYTGSVKVVCKDDFGEPVVGAVFEILKDGTQESVSSPKTTNSAGEAVFSGLEQGTYTIVQKSAPSGWYKSNLTGKGYILKVGDLSVVDIINQRVKGSVTVYKVDSVTKTPIEGSILGIFNHETDMLYKYAVSDKSGKAVFQDIPAGEWYIWEIKPAFGYVHNTTILGDKVGCQRTHTPSGYTEVLYSNTVSNDNAETTKEAPSLLASIFNTPNFFAFTIDEGNTDITIDGDGNVSGGTGNTGGDGENSGTSGGDDNTGNNSGNQDNTGNNSGNGGNTNTPGNGGTIISPGEKIKGNIAVTVTIDGKEANGINVQLHGPNVTTTKTTTNGVAIFNDLTVGTYTVALVNPISGYSVPSAESVVITENNVTKYVTLKCETLRSSEIEVVLEDDDNKAELDGVKVKLYDDTKNRVLSTDTTGSRGRVYFDNLEGGTYYVFVDEDSVDDYELDDNEYTRVIIGNKESKRVTLSFSRIDTAKDDDEVSTDNNIPDFVATIGTITGRLWKDTNNDGKFDTSDSVVAGRKVEIKNGSVVVATAITGTDGIFSANVIPGNYTVQVALNTNESIVVSKSNEYSLNNSILTPQGSKNVQVTTGSIITVSGALSVETPAAETPNSNTSVNTGTNTNNTTSNNTTSNLPKTGEGNTMNYALMLSINIVLFIGSIVFLRRAWNTK